MTVVSRIVFTTSLYRDGELAQRVRHRKQTVTVGTAGDSDIQLVGDRVPSRMGALSLGEAGGVHYRQLAENRRPTLNGMTVNVAALQPGDRLALGVLGASS